MSVNWNALYEKTSKLNPRVQEIFKEWIKAHPNWTGWISFDNYPPRFYGKFEILHINRLSEKHLQEVGELTTKLCNECGLMGKKVWSTDIGKNEVNYKFRLPIE